jgi:hypothetical protein
MWEVGRQGAHYVRLRERREKRDWRDKGQREIRLTAHSLPFIFFTSHQIFVKSVR